MGRNDPRMNEDTHTPYKFKVRYIFYAAFVLLVMLAVFTYNAADAAVLQGGSDQSLQNAIGYAGALVSYWCFLLFGLATYVMLGLFVLGAIRMMVPPPLRRRWLHLLGVVLAMTGAMVLFAISPEAFSTAVSKLGLGRGDIPQMGLSGGIIGQLLAAPQTELNSGGVLRMFIGVAGSSILAWSCLTAGLLIFYWNDWHRVLIASKPKFDELSDFASRAAEGVLNRVQGQASATPPVMEESAQPSNEPVAGEKTVAEHDKEKEEESVPGRWRQLLGGGPAKTEQPETAAQRMSVDDEEPETPPLIAEENTPVVPVSSMASSAPVIATAPLERIDDTPNVQVTVAARQAEHNPFAGEFVLPPLTMLGKGEDISGESPESIARCRDILQRTLDDFKVDGQVSGHVSGPRVTRYEITLAPGVKVSKVAELTDNIAMNLAAKSVRVLAPIPGRPLVGVETPNVKPEAVFMRSIMESDAWQKSTAEIPIVLGKDIAGNPALLDLARAPHLLIAGSTGSGKSVCMNTLIMSLLFRFRPDELRLIMVDPKVVEFEDYRALPHLITPVVNDSRKVPIALRWAVNEMEKRYRILAKAGVKKIAEYNKRANMDEVILDDDDLPIPRKMPVLVVIVDELADLMMTDARKDAETSIARIAQKGRAAGVHIVIATQRPSRDIITGVIKANLPTKIAFMVGSLIDSRVILDQSGAEMLLGRGDMLFLPPGQAVLERIQGAMVDDKDIKKIVEFVSAQAPQSFDSQVVAEEENEEDSPGKKKGRKNYNEDEDEDDDDTFIEPGGPDPSPLIAKYLKINDTDLFRQALEIVILERKASTSYLQRRLGIGYNRAAELIDQLEARNIVGPAQQGGSKREVLVLDELQVQNF